MASEVTGLDPLPGSVVEAVGYGGDIDVSGNGRDGMIVYRPCIIDRPPLPFRRHISSTCLGETSFPYSAAILAQKEPRQVSYIVLKRSASTAKERSMPSTVLMRSPLLDSGDSQDIIGPSSGEVVVWRTSLGDTLICSCLGTLFAKLQWSGEPFVDEPTEALSSPSGVSGCCGDPSDEVRVVREAIEAVRFRRYPPRETWW